LKEKEKGNLGDYWSTCGTLFFPKLKIKKSPMTHLGWNSVCCTCFIYVGFSQGSRVL